LPKARWHVILASNTAEQVVRNLEELLEVLQVLGGDVWSTAVNYRAYIQVGKIFRARED
jgi:hypothetical protein